MPRPYNFHMKHILLPAASPTVAVPQQHQPTRPIRSFVLRQGRMSPAQTRAYEVLGPKFLLPFSTAATLNTTVIFDRDLRNDAPLIIEIGFGMGEVTAKIARTLIDTNFIGIEVHRPGVGALLKLIGEHNIDNLRIIQHDAVEVLKNIIADSSIAAFHIFFPDPWPKKRHHKRRLIQPALVTLLTQKLKPGGYVHLATDWNDYAHHMLELLRQERALCNTPDAVNGFAPRPHYRSSSSFERKGLAKGHDVWDLVFHKI